MGRRDLLICAGLALAVLAVFIQATTFDFINLDDADYVSGNPHVRGGPTIRNVLWAFGTFRNGNWHPLTWLSHMVDCRLFGVRPGPHHLTNVLLHAANGVLLYVFLRRATAETWPSAFASALFALHPLHVESVAWVSERKDVLSTMFWMLVLCAWTVYAEAPRPSRYAAALLLFAVGLTCKPMLVTLPFVLLLVDFWPLRRRPSLGLAAEKLPFLLLSAVSCVITYRAQISGGAVVGTDVIPLGVRIANASLSPVRYAARMVWPSGLAAFYPIGRVPWWQAGGAALLLALGTVTALGQRRRRPFVPVGWFWFLGTLVPVIGLVQVGSQSLADRYTYVPLIGLFLIVAWGSAELAGRMRPRGVPVALPAASACGVLLVLAILSWRQAALWKSSAALFSHAVAVTENNWLAHANLASALALQGRTDEAVAHYEEALRINPGHARSHNNLGFILAARGRLDDAIVQYTEALRNHPDYALAHDNLGVALAKQGRIAEAIAHFREALRGLPDDAAAHYDLANALLQAGSLDDAIAEYSEALRLDPASAPARNNLGLALARSGRTREAVAVYRDLLAASPDYVEAHYNLGAVLAGEGRLEEAIVEFSTALRLRPDLAAARRALASAEAARAGPPAR